MTNAKWQTRRDTNISNDEAVEAGSPDGAAPNQIS